MVEKVLPRIKRPEVSSGSSRCDSLKSIHHGTIVSRRVGADLSEEQDDVEVQQACVGPIRSLATCKEFVESRWHDWMSLAREISG